MGTLPLNSHQSSQSNSSLSGKNGLSGATKWYRFKFLNFPSLRILFWRGSSSKGSGRRDSRGYAKLTDDSGDQNIPEKGSEEGETRILASAVVPSYSPLQLIKSNSSVAKTEAHETNPISHLSENELTPETKAETETAPENQEIVQSYKIVKMLPLQETPRPVLIYGPFSHIIAARLEATFPDLFRVCSRKDVTSALTMCPSSPDDRKWEYTTATTSEDTLKCIALGDIEDIAAEGRHPVLSVAVNTVAEFRRHSLYPIVVGLRFRSAKHIKDTVNKWSTQQQQGPGQGSGSSSLLQLGPRTIVGYKFAKTSYAHQLKLEQAFPGAATDVRVAGNNIAFMCAQIKDRVGEQQSKVVWRDADQQ